MMDLLDAINERHSVRKYLDTPIQDAIKEQLVSQLNSINEANGLSFQLITDEPKAFGNITATYGLLRNVHNYIALVGQDSDMLNEKAGYFGEQLVLLAQQLGLNTCWVAGTYKKGAVPCVLKQNERLVCVIAIGYGAVKGKPHRSRNENKLYRCEHFPAPYWFLNGLRCAMLAPTAINQQKFLFTLSDKNLVKAEATGGFYSDIDLGIVKLHFEIGAGTDNFIWA